MFQFKTVHKKLLIIGLATLLLEAVIVTILYKGVNAFYADLTNRMALMLTEQVKSALTPETLNFSEISRRKRRELRRLMRGFSDSDSQILQVLLIDKNHRIVLSSDPQAEGLIYRKESELKLLKTRTPQIVNRTWQGNIGILDVIYPLYRDDELIGYLRTVISVQHLQSFYRNRKPIILGASVFTFIIILLTVLFTSRIYQKSLKEINTALTQLDQSNFEFKPSVQKGDELEPVYTGLSRLFEKTADLSESFRQSEKRIQAMMKVIHEGLLIMDRDMKIVTYNEYLLELLHVRKHSEIEGQLYQIFQNNPRLVEIYRRSKDPLTHTVKRILTLKLPDSATVNVQVHTMGITDHHGVSGVIFYFKNLGLIHELEQNLHRSMKYGLISQLASSIGHEIRNPLSSLAIHTEIIKNMVGKSIRDPDRLQKIHKSLHILNVEIERLQSMIDQFFNLAKSREIELSYENINDLIEETIALVQQQAYERNIRIQCQYANHVPMVKISRDKIKQVIINIILNSFDAMPEGGDLRIRTVHEDGRVKIAIQDTGLGIPEDIQQHIFEFYFTTKENGGGIGLAISRKIVEAHEGELYFESREGKGTTFYIDLPTNVN